MSERTTTIIKAIAQGAIDRTTECPDYKGKKKKDEMILNYFIGACKLAQIQKDDELVHHLTSVICFVCAISGHKGVIELINKG